MQQLNQAVAQKNCNLKHNPEVSQLLDEFEKINSIIDREQPEQIYQIINILLRLGDKFFSNRESQQEQSLRLMDIHHSLMFYNTVLKTCNKVCDDNQSINFNSLEEQANTRIVTATKQLLTDCGCDFKLCSNESVNDLIAQNIVGLKILRQTYYYNLDRCRNKLDLLSRSNANYNHQLTKAKYLQNMMAGFSVELKKFIADIAKQAQKLLGESPCKYAIIGLGSLAKQTATPYSDLEYTILLEEQSEDSLKYFRNLAHIIQAVIINLGETAIPYTLVDVSFDKLTGAGFSVDLGGKTPLGRRYDNGKLKYELIATPERLIRYLDDSYFGVDKLLPTILQQCTHVHGDENLTNDYKKIAREYFDGLDHRTGEKIYQQRALALLRGNSNAATLEISDLKFVITHIKETDMGAIFNVKKDIYRLVDRLIDDLALYYGISNQESTSKTIEKLLEEQIISEWGYKNLQIMNAIANELRLITYTYYKNQEHQLYVMGHETRAENKFHIEHNKYLLFEFFYRAIPFSQAIMEWQKNPENLKYFSDKSFFNSECLTEVEIHCRLNDFERAKDLLDQQDPNYLTANDEKEYYALKGFVYSYCGEYDSAIEGYQKSVDLYMNDLYRGYPHPCIAKIYLNMGIVCHDKGEIDRAFYFHDKALEMRMDSSAGYIDIASSWYNLGMICEEQNQLYQAIMFAYNKALALHKYNGDTKSSHYADILNVIANFNVSIDPDDSINKLNQALKIKQAIYGEEHFDVAKILNNIGMYYCEIGIYDKAAEYTNRAISIWHKIGITGGSNYALSLNNLGMIEHKQGNIDRALKIYQQADGSWKNFFSRHGKRSEINSHYYAKILNNIGCAYKDNKDLNNAFKYHLQALEIKQKSYGGDSLDVANTKYKMAMIHKDQGELDKAVKLLEQVERQEDHRFFINATNEIDHCSWLRQAKLKGVSGCFVPKRMHTIDRGITKMHTRRGRPYVAI